MKIICGLIGDAILLLFSDSDDEKQASKESSERNGKSKGAAPNPEFWSKVNPRNITKAIKETLQK